jgi:hypothetical protein
LNTLLVAENEMVKDALDAGVAIAKARTAAPSDAVAALEKFGARLTEALHGDISTMLGPGMRSLGTLLLLDVARRAGAIAPETDAILNLEFLKPAAIFDAGSLLAAGHVRAEDLAFADRVVT